jgi:hypothetical protein
VTLLACGLCLDGNVLFALPFVFYWLLVFLLWSLGFGTWLAFARRNVYGPPIELPMNPLRYLLVAPLLIVVLVPFTMGAVLAPLVPLMLVWFVRLGLSIRAPVLPTIDEPRRARLVSIYRSVQRVVFTAALLLVPVAYVRWYVQMHAIGMM